MKSYRSWCLAFFTPVLALLFAISLSSLPVSAATVFDDLVKTASTLVVTDIETGDNERNITSNFTAIMHDKCETAYNSYVAALTDSNGRWAIVQNTAFGDAYKSVLVGWSTNSSHTTIFDEVGPKIAVQTQHQVEILLYNNEYYCNTSENPALAIAGTTDRTKIFLSTYPVEYPDGYEGEIIPDTYSPKVDYYPQFDWAVSNMSLAITSFKKIPGGLNYFDATLTKADSEWNTIGDAVDTDLHRLLYAGSTSSLNALDYGRYILAVKIYPPPGSALLDDYNFKTTYVQINVDGSIFAGNSYGDNCTAGVCEEGSQYEDCGSYGVDIIGGIGCHFRNFGLFLTITLKDLFIPDGRKIASFFDHVNDYLHQKLGFLLYPYDWFFGLFSSFASSTASCAGWNMSAVPSVQPSGTFFGSHVNLNPCSAQSSFPQIYNIAVFFIRVVTVLGMIYAVYRKLLMTLGNHDRQGRALYS